MSAAILPSVHDCRVRIMGMLRLFALVLMLATSAYGESVATWLERWQA